MFGIPGAALGYCQALFSREGDGQAHTEKTRKLLREIGAPWAESHEIFWDYRRGEAPNEYLEACMEPLLDGGRVPILITSLDPATDAREIQTIVETNPPIRGGETVLLRLVLGSPTSAAPMGRLLRRLVAEASEEGAMPRWWPLLQGDLTREEWAVVEREAGDLWPYINIAVNPFTASTVVDVYPEQVTVAQVVVGLAAGVTSAGTVSLPHNMRISGAPRGAFYSLPRYMDLIAHLPEIPTLILLGPAQEGWQEKENLARVDAILGILRGCCQKLWGSLGKGVYEEVWELSA